MGAPCYRLGPRNIAVNDADDAIAARQACSDHIYELQANRRQCVGEIVWVSAAIISILIALLVRGSTR